MFSTLHCWICQARSCAEILIKSLEITLLDSLPWNLVLLIWKCVCVCVCLWILCGAFGRNTLEFGQLCEMFFFSAINTKYTTLYSVCSFSVIYLFICLLHCTVKDATWTPNHIRYAKKSTDKLRMHPPQYDVLCNMFIFIFSRSIWCTVGRLSLNL